MVDLAVNLIFRITLSAREHRLKLPRRNKNVCHLFFVPSFMIKKILFDLLWIAPSIVMIWTLTSHARGDQELNSTPPVYTGSKIKLSDAESQSDVIFVGKITKLGLLSPRAAGYLGYFGNRVEIDNVFLGLISDSFVKASIIIEASPHLKEAPPEAGKSYIFFAKKNEETSYDTYSVLKLIPATDTDIANVKKLISSGTVPK